MDGLTEHIDYYMLGLLSTANEIVFTGGEQKVTTTRVG